MKHPKMQMAVVTPNVLVNLGLKSIIERIVPMVEVWSFSSAEELASSGEQFLHSFVSASLFRQQPELFVGGGRPPILLTEGSAPMSEAEGLPHLNINQSEEALVKDILRLHHAAHPHGAHPSLPHAAHPHQMHHSTPCEAPAATSLAQGEESLSAREIEVLSLIVKGLLNKEIADKLNIGLTTVISHRRNIVEKLGTRSVSALTIYAVMRGYVNINEI